MRPPPASAAVEDPSWNLEGFESGALVLRSLGNQVDSAFDSRNASSVPVD